jgi:imidazole glycerol phosphate synthase subunit HisF
MVNHYGADKVSINSNGVDQRDQALRAEIIQRINTVSELMKRNVVLLLDENRANEEVFPGQLEAKRTLVELLQEFGIRSGLDHKIEWTNPKKAQKMLEDSIYREQRIELLRDNKHTRRISYNILAP